MQYLEDKDADLSGGVLSDTCFQASLTAPLDSEAWASARAVNTWCTYGRHKAHHCPHPAAHVTVPVFPITLTAADLALTSVPLSCPLFHTHSAPSPPPPSRGWPGKAAALSGARAAGGRGEPTSPAPPTPGWSSARSSSRSGGWRPSRRRSGLGARGGARRHRPFPVPAPGGP